MTKKDDFFEDSIHASDASQTEGQVEGLAYPSHEALEQELNVLELKLTEYKDAAMRAKAEAENTRRRAEREVEQAHKYGHEKIVADLLPVLDSLIRGLDGMTTSSDPHVKALQEGMSLTLELLEKVIQKHGVAVISPVRGEAFDPARHEAMSMQSLPDMTSNVIVQVLQNGYELNGRVIRAAMVIVSA